MWRTWTPMLRCKLKVEGATAHFYRYNKESHRGTFFIKNYKKNNKGLIMKVSSFVQNIVRNAKREITQFVYLFI